MNKEQLDKFPKLKQVLSPAFRDQLKCIFDEISPKFTKSLLNSYSLFIALTETETNYTALDILNSEEKLNHQLRTLVGFIYTDIIPVSLRTKYTTASLFKRAFRTLAEQNQLTVTPISLSFRSLSDDARHCQQHFTAQSINQEAVKYYQGWTCVSKEGKHVNLHLAPFRDAFGEAMTSNIYQALRDYALTQKSSSLRSNSLYIITILNLLSCHCKTPEQLSQRLQPIQSVRLMEEVMLDYFFDAQIKGNSTKHATKQWGCMVYVFTSCFIDTGVFAPPATAFITPHWKEPKNHKHSISVGGKLSKNEIDRWLVNIPLTIKDDDALVVIYQRLNQDLEHIKTVSEQMVERIKQRHQRNNGYIETGMTKPLPVKGNKNKNRGFPIGADHINNTVATFYHYGAGEILDFPMFLGFAGKKAALIVELNLPTLETLNAFIALLILEHPLITPSWLEFWELFDKHGNQVGFFQSGKQWLIRSVKNRRGAMLAQQEVILTPYSKGLVEALIEHTAFARATMKQHGDNNYRYMIQIWPSPMKKPRRYELLGERLSHARSYNQKLAVASNVLTQDDAEQLASIITPRTIRKSRGLQIYFETRSLRAVAEALGHAKIDTELLGKYLPAPLMDFFNARWVRQFQNAIIYQALKDSPYLFDALDFNEDKLNEFLENHGLGTLPDQLTKVKEGSLDVQDVLDHRLDELVFMLSIPLFQVLIALQQVITSASEEEAFKPVVERWCEVAEFILSQFATTGKSANFYNGDKACQTLYQCALANPLPIDSFKEGLLCR